MMTVCTFPGCVAAAVDARGFCPVHASGRGKRCDTCAGSGRLMRVDPATGRDRTYACDVCGGVGIQDQRRSAVPRAAASEPVDTRGLITASERSKS
jgi:hypothetical protein